MRRGLTFDQVRLVPVHNNVKSRNDPDLRTQITRDRDMALPILASNMKSVMGRELALVMQRHGIIPILHRFAKVAEITKLVESLKGKCFISSGVTDESIGQALEVFSTDAEGILGVCIDIAHGHSVMMYRAIEEFKAQCGQDFQVIAGNVCTAEGYRDLVNAGADAVKVGIGPGAACTTRDVTGFGVPQMQACLDIGEVAKKLRVPFIADGGIRHSGDIVKALAAGASSVMLGKVFACTNESAAQKNNENGLEALYCGQASATFQANGMAPEGTEEWLPVTGSAYDVIKNLTMGIRSGFTYGGARTIWELQRKADWVEVGRGA